MLVVLPGTVLPSRPLLTVLRDDHEARAADYAMRKAWRDEHGVPSTPDIDWSEHQTRLKAMLEIASSPMPDVSAMVLGHQLGLVAMSPAPKDPGEWTAPEGLERISVKPVALSAKTRNTLRDAWRAAVEGGDARASADELICAVIREVGGVEVYGATDYKPLALTPEAMEPLWEAGLAPYLLTAALHLSSLDPKKALRSGGLPLPT